MVTQSTHERLRTLINEIFAEERRFEEHSRRMHIDQHHLDELHNTHVDRSPLDSRHDRLRSAHEAMFKVHRKIIREHRHIIEYCQRLQSRLTGGFIPELEMQREALHLSSLLAQVREEHELMEKER
ncbi:MAG: hypothetical protein D6800_08010, partial [Candidatus Zixiibacteriota bacterium]